MLDPSGDRPPGNKIGFGNSIGTGSLTPPDTAICRMPLPNPPWSRLKYSRMPSVPATIFPRPSNVSCLYSEICGGGNGRRMYQTAIATPTTRAAPGSSHFKNPLCLDLLPDFEFG